MQSSMCRVSRRFQFLFSRFLSIGAGKRVSRYSPLTAELIRGRGSPLEIMIQFLDRQLKVLTSRLKRGPLDERHRTFQDRGSLLRGTQYLFGLAGSAGHFSIGRSTRELGIQIGGRSQRLGRRIVATAQ